MAKASRDPVTAVTPQQERFACEFAKTGRAILSYRRAYNAEGMNDDSCDKEANRLLHDQRVAARVQHYRAVAARVLDKSVEEIAQQLARIAFLDIRDCYDEKGRLLPPHELPTDIALALDGIDVVEMQGGMKITLPAPKVPSKSGGKDGAAAADEPAIQHIPMYTKKIKHGRLEALKMLATYKGMLGGDAPRRGDLSELSEEEFNREYEAMKATVEMIERARSRGTLVHKQKKLASPKQA